MNNFLDIVIYFMIFSISGWACETVFCTIKDKKFAYRGFLNGPWTPIYGFGGLLVVYCLVPFKADPVTLFFVGMIVTTALEYVTSYLMEVIFDMKWWDYSDVSFNINGRVCLWFSVMFGLLSLVAVYWIYPPFEAIFLKMDYNHKMILAFTFLAIFIADVSVTVYMLFSLNNTLKGLQENRTNLENALTEALQHEDVTVTGILKTVKETYIPLEQVFKTAQESLTPEQQEIVELYAQKEERFKMFGLHQLHLNRIVQAFPRLESKKYSSSLGQLKEKAKNIKEKHVKKENNGN